MTPNVHLQAHPQARHLSVYPWSGAPNVDWVACSSPASRSTKVPATVDLLAALPPSCLWPERCEEGRGGGGGGWHHASRHPLFVRLWREQASVDWHCLALIRSPRHLKREKQRHASVHRGSCAVGTVLRPPAPHQHYPHCCFFISPVLAQDAASLARATA
ncbi:unnamed protein product [Pleuronectes platessa]|uniref:Uncharacterized protein n=1 Tax=Pleuronectes platessa TaxID=8262 RepID=A0A9N7Y3T4_PLEPL|nr:unnamed protein product [Pleuronectes platessa]